MLNRDEMAAIIRSGGSVMYNGEVFNDVNKLPSEAELAKGDKVREAAARASLQAQLRDAQAQLDMLSDGSEVEEAETETAQGVDTPGEKDREQITTTEEGKAAAEADKTDATAEKPDANKADDKKTAPKTK